jgi:hypothetical protein
MIMPRALVSSATSMVDEDLREDHLKLCFLWYDEVLIETIGAYDERRFFEGLLGAERTQAKLAHALSDVIVPLDRRVSQDVIGDLMTRSGPGYPRWGKDYENYTYPDPENGAQYAHNMLLEHLATERGLARFNDGYDVQMAEGAAGSAVDAVLLWERVNAEMPCVLQTNACERIALTSAQAFSAGSDVSSGPFKLFNAEIPSLRHVSWSQIVAFRKDGSLRSLREKFSSSFEAAGGDAEQTAVLFDQSEQDALDAIVDGSRTNTKQVVIESIVANVPGLPVNPVSVMLGLRDAVRSYKKNSHHGWLYLLRDIRKSVPKSQDAQA